jgi:hypothetical protein
MHRLAILILFGLCSVASRAQGGTIDFMNRNIPGYNGAPSYNVPIWRFDSATEGAGTLPGGVTVGLFEAGATTPLVTTLLRSDTPANAAFFATATQTAVTSSLPGTTPQFFVRAWNTSAGSYFASQANGLGWAEWTFISQPLGGTPPGGGLPVPTPGMTGWGPGPVNGGFTFPIIPEPSTIALSVLGIGAVLLRRHRNNLKANSDRRP